MKRIIFLTTIIFLFPLTIGAVPQFLNHQGYSSDNQGNPVTGSVNVAFNLYSVESEGSSLWTQTIPVTFDGGYYSVVLGPGSPELSVDIFDGSDLYMGVTLEGQNEFLPRVKIVSVPYAFRAEAVEGEVKAVGGLVVDGVEVINDQQQWIGLNVSFNDLADVPEDLADGDDLGLEGSGTDGTLAQFTESGVADSVVVESDGKIGIGITDPQSAFHVAGGLQIADETGDCVEGKAGTLRWHENALEVCDGTEWGSIGGSSIGQGQGQAAIGCQAIVDAGASQGDGLYWIDLTGGNTDDAFQAYCDMTRDGGGWMLVVRANNQGDLSLNTNDAHNDPPEPDGNSSKFSHATIQAAVDGSQLTNPVKIEFPEASVSRYIWRECSWASSTNRNKCASWAADPNTSTHVTHCGAGDNPSLNNGNGGEWASNSISWPFQDGTCARNGGFANGRPNGCSGSGNGDAFCNYSGWSAKTGLSSSGWFKVNIWVK